MTCRRALALFVVCALAAACSDAQPGRAGQGGGGGGTSSTGSTGGGGEATAFTMELSPDEVSVPPGGSTDVAVTLERGSTFNEPVVVTTSGLPPGVTASPLEIPFDASEGTLSLDVAPGAEPGGPVVVTVTAAGGGQQREAGLALTITSSAGALDRTFGDRGKVSPDLGADMERAAALALASDGKLVVVGSTGSFTTVKLDFLVARYQDDGALDTSFGDGGKKVLDLGSDGDEARAVAIQPDGKIVIVGSTATDMAVVRLAADGTPDDGFGAGGTVLLDFGGFEDGHDVALTGDGHVLVVGSGFGTSGRIHLARLDPSGAPDGAFGSAGKVTADLGEGIGAIEETPSLALQEDGKIVVATSATVAQNHGFAVARFLADGSPDDAFGSAGSVSVQFGVFEDAARDVVVQPDGKLLVAGLTSVDVTYDIAMVRLDASGTLDGSFGASGRVTTDLGDKYDWLSAIVLLPDGRIAGAGQTGNDSSGFEWAAVRYQADGSLDDTFAQAGVALFDFGDVQDVAKDLVLQPDGKLVLAGWCGSAIGPEYQFGLARLLP